MEIKEKEKKEDQIEFKWKPIYGWVLAANVIYILFFYFVMISNR